METEFIVKIVSVEPVTHDVKQFNIEKPTGYKFAPGQATEVSINQPKWKDEKRPFTFTGLNDDNHLQFTIKLYEDHHGVTEQLGTLQPGDELIIREVWGAIAYLGKGVFLAGGAGVTPFIAILRQLYVDGQIEGNTLIISNKTEADIILREEFERMRGLQFINTLTNEVKDGYDNRLIDKEYLREKISDFKQPFYICGPPAFVKNISAALLELGANPEAVVFEK